MTFSYNQNIPNPPNDPADDVGIMQTNAQAIAGIIAVDHVGFNVVNGGTHNQVTFAKNQTAPGFPAGAVADMFANIATGQSWPFWQNALGSFQMLGPNTSTANGSTFLPGGIILKWGNATTSGSGTPNSTITFGTAFPANCFAAVCTTTETSTNRNFVVVYGISASQLQVTAINSGGSAQSGVSFYWFAIGN